MSLALERTQRVPLSKGSDGVIRVAGTRVTLDTVAYAFERGATAEEIVQQYPALPLADVYLLLGYLLQHQAEVARYLAARSERGRAVRKQNERRFSSNGLRARLRARQRSPGHKG